MTTFDAVRTGFRIARRYPRIGGIETIWRTAYAILVVLFVLTGSSFFLQNVILSNLELKALRSKVAPLVSLEIQHLLLHYWPDLWHLLLFVSAMAGLMWLLFASTFRPGILGLLAEAFQPERPPAKDVSIRRGFAYYIKAFFRRVGMVNVTYLFFSTLVMLLSAGVFWGSVMIGSHLPEAIAPLVTIVCLTAGLTVMFFAWAVVDLVTDIAQIAVVFEGLSFSASIRRTAEVIQKRIGAVIGIGLIIFVLRCVVTVFFGLLNLGVNFVLGALWSPLVIGASAIFWFVQSVFVYYLYIVNLASFACLLERHQPAAVTPLPISEKIIYEH